MHHVTDSLLIGNLKDAQNPPAFIEGLLFLAAEYDITPPDGLLFAKIPLIEFSLADPNQVHKAVAWLEQHAPTRKVMVCCRAGMGRSVSMVIAYLCCVQGMTYQDALSLLKTRRPGAMPLPELEATIQQVVRMREKG
jgi:protein-tyrosine phosphatase